MLLPRGPRQLLLLGEGCPVEPVLSVGWFRLARLTTDSHQGEESLDLSLLVLASFCWQSQGYGKRGALGCDLIPSLLWQCSSGLSFGSVSVF